MAWTDAGLDQESVRERWNPDRAGVAWGTAIGGIEWLERSVVDRVHGRRLSPFFVAGILPNMTAGNVSIALNLRGPSICQATACAASSHRSEEHTSELQSLMRISYAVFCLTTKTLHTQTTNITN